MASLLRSLQLGLVLTNLLIILFGVTVVAVGAWALKGEEDLFSITDNRTELYRLPYSLILVGICVVCMAVLGIIGALTTKMIGGRLLLGVYSFVLALVIFSEIAAGGSAIRALDTFEETFIDSSVQSIKKYTSRSEKWDEFQIRYQCCGAKNYTSYTTNNYTVPKSCCKHPESSECETARQDPSDSSSTDLNLEGCPHAVLHYLRRDFIVIAAVMMVVGVSQYVGVVMACLVAFISSKEENEPYSYSKLSTVST